MMSFYLESGDKPLAIAHRGGSSEAPENTSKAFQHSVDLGYKYLETDVRLTKDNVLVIYHDKKVDRLTTGKGKLSDLTWDEVSKLRISGEPIPRAEEVLSSWPGICWNIDPKQSACVAPLAKILRNLKLVDNVCIGSFLDRRQKLAQKLLGEGLTTSAGPVQVARFKFKLNFGRKRSYQCLQVPIKFDGVRILTPQFVERAHKVGLKVHVWTIDEPSEMEKLLDWGVDGIITDAPSQLKEVFIHRGIW